MNPILNKTFLVTTTNWFLAPNGQQYKAVFGTLKGINPDNVTIGNMTIDKNNIFCWIQTNSISQHTTIRDIEKDGILYPINETISRIYNADETY